MTEGITGSTVPRRQLGRNLRNLRGQSRLTVRAVAKELAWSEPKIWRIEYGQTGTRQLDVEALCRIYGVLPDMTEALMALAKETKARGCWHSFGDVIPEYFDVYIGLEEAASHFFWFGSELVPGLLQTEDYARAMIQLDNPGVGDAEIERRVQVRMARQTLLTRITTPPTLNIVLNEGHYTARSAAPSSWRANLSGYSKPVRCPPCRSEYFRSPPDCTEASCPGHSRFCGSHSTATARRPNRPRSTSRGFTGALYLDKPYEIERYDAVSPTSGNHLWTRRLPGN